MTRLNIKPTRMELNNLKERLKTATRGHKLLKDKRDELMRRFIEAVRENNRLRQKVEEALVGHMQDFVLAKALESDLMVEEIFAVPMREINLHIEQENIMSVRVPKMHAHIANPYGDDEGDVVYSYVASNSQMDETIEDMSNLLPDLLRLAEIEKSCQLMADEIEKTRRRVNGLEYATIPDLIETIQYIEMKLEEAERASLVRVMKVK
ncbi:MULTISPECIES: V-type ATP synthase subunit D [Streptococcus]|uniref:V-type ATP synthase subunit D n=6 Tax=Streptococcus TaxID=1301 RepID=F9P9S6_STRCV|nr:MULTISPECIES: V-type ATP synthase subunit D [Streptococcus]AGU71993.1 V-type ATP synthase subunit D [Streptococcus constellatus subsp. pharyngis C232]AGU73749.1 V-type ATP synthase subunit D [Streptococcus constellatus subsp. pharyngis C818]AGU79117.1 V-type ATP synthase subunit D [Streptococcus constellatus subsp. pharyngis C1050]EGV06890.1 V-type ATPase, D subunit [Streptococcus constellatus subsp. pharyngis SK1060 = CCUG 46377]EID19306.1 V-type ATPase, D subunit [Streptococcus constellat